MTSRTPPDEPIPFDDLGMGHRAVQLLATESEFCAGCSIVEFAGMLTRSANPLLPFPPYPNGQPLPPEIATPLAQTKTVLQQLADQGNQVAWAIRDLISHGNIK